MNRIESRHSGDELITNNGELIITHTNGFVEIYETIGKKVFRLRFEHFPRNIARQTEEGNPQFCSVAEFDITRLEKWWEKNRDGFKPNILN